MAQLDGMRAFVFYIRRSDWLKTWHTDSYDDRALRWAIVGSITQLYYNRRMEDRQGPLTPTQQERLPHFVKLFEAGLYRLAKSKVRVRKDVTPYKRSVDLRTISVHLNLFGNGRLTLLQLMCLRCFSSQEEYADQRTLKMRFLALAIMMVKLRKSTFSQTGLDRDFSEACAIARVNISR